jgi:predicted O-methyltransferase YrrM
MTREILEDLKSIAQRDKVPVMLPDGLSFCLELIQERNITSILEIGTAIGLWSISIAQAFPNIRIESIELDEQRYRIALDAINACGLEKQITLHNTDAKSFESDRLYDLIFLDGPKSAHKTLFNRFMKNLSPKGCFLIDNMAFHGLKEQREQLGNRRNLQQMMTKIEAFRAWISEHPDYITMEVSVGDGLLLVWRKYQ